MMYNYASITNGNLSIITFLGDKKMESRVTITLDYQEKNITMEFNNMNNSALEVAKKLWGPDAEGQPEVARSPRGWKKLRTELEEEYEKAIELLCS